MVQASAPRVGWVAAATLLAALAVLLSPLNGALSRPLHDWQARLLAPDAPPTDVLVVDIDDRSLAALKAQFGPWPFRRDVYALAVDQLRGLGATAIAFDLLLADAQPGDEALARAIARPGAPVVLAAAGLLHASDDSAPLTGIPRSSHAPPTGAHVWPTITLPTPSVWPASGAPPPLGIITTPLDADGVLRALPLWHTAGGAPTPLPLLPLAVHVRLHGANDAAAPHDGAAQFRPPFAAARAAVPVLPFAELLLAPATEGAAQVLRQRVQGRAVFIGSSALLADAVMTVQGQITGTSALAQTYTALRKGSGLQPPTLWADALLVLLALLPAAAALRRGHAAPRPDALATALSALLMAAVAAALLLGLRQPTLWAAPLATLAFGLALSLLLYQRQQAAAQRSLAQALAVAAETARAKGQFLANVSHEIRTPLGALLGVAELLAASPLTPTQQRQVRLFQDAGRTLHELINDLLDLSKMDAGHLDLESQPFSLHQVLERVADLMRPRAEGKGLQLLVERGADVPDGVLGDRMRLEQALNNLVGNAIKFTSRGEVRLRARPDADTPGSVCIEVVDTGIGIAPSKLDTIFEPYKQADSSVARNYGGTGLGLAITRRVVGLMGGRIEVTSTPGMGSVFRLRLPLPPATLEALPAAPAVALLAPPENTRTRSVLLAEDNEVNVYLFRAMLEGQPLAIEVAPNGLTALDMLTERAYDLAFIDIQMPGMDGLSVTRALRLLEARSGRARTPVVALTANAFASDIQASLDAGCDRHMAKPYPKSELLQALADLATGDAAPAHATPADAVPAGLPVAPPTAEFIGTPTMPPVLPFDPARALQRLGGDTALYQRVVEHASVFMEGWPQAFERASLDTDPSLALRLAHDLKSVSASLGADELSARAADVEHAIASAAVAPDTRALLATLTPVIVALSRARTAP